VSSSLTAQSAPADATTLELFPKPRPLVGLAWIDPLRCKEQRVPRRISASPTLVSFALTLTTLVIPKMKSDQEKFIKNDLATATLVKTAYFSF
jgi:hypothetical protein